MMLELHILFKTLSTHKKAKGPFNHKRFMQAVKAMNALFDNDEHHDSHEFISWLIDTVHEKYLLNEQKKAQKAGLKEVKADPNASSFVTDLFRGTLSNIVTCTACEKTTNRDENFFNLSIDIERNTSLSYCLQRFSVKELLNRDNKLHCEACLTKQVATKEMTVSRFPKLLLVHLKRFKVDPQTY